MKKILLIIILLFTGLNVYAVDTWDSNVLAVYSFEGNGNDLSTNGYNLINIGAGPQYKTEGDAKYGSQTMAIGSSTASLGFPVALTIAVAALGNTGAWTIEGYMKKADGGWNSFVSGDHRDGRGTASYGVDNYNTSGNHQYQWGINGNLSANITSAWNTNWIFISFQYDNGVCKLYEDGFLLSTKTGRTNPFINTTYLSEIGINSSGESNVNNRYDKIIISKVARNGVETLPLAQTPTITQTFTNSPTQTNTPTYTITKTITQTATPTYTATRTITQTNTPTYTATKTITATVTPTVTPTFTTTPTFTRTPMVYPTQTYNRPVIAYKVKQTSGKFVIVWKYQYAEFLQWSLMYSLSTNGVINGITITPLR